MLIFRMIVLGEWKRRVVENKTEMLTTLDILLDNAGDLEKQILEDDSEDRFLGLVLAIKSSLVLIKSQVVTDLKKEQYEQEN